ncbi:ADP-ribosylation factor-binding protein GGA1 [Chionoecetes opilio]|uniref:ADP-ribosylation factor-binding protein GGA1 n=1 Tax=Chionoecetes opilio TaxID=41210 RepID=A0A8J4Y252_CHIOP|nr:ADP-ribosylation factor-binding protein GGA1 [Chionoecetes opilio]
MIKLVSPKYLGNHTHPAVKERVVELLYSWTLDLKGETKIVEAYNMLKKQGIVKDDPRYLGAPCVPEPRPRANAVFEDEEKSRMLQKLLRSRNPEDLQKANALIKSMVKEEERRMERSTRRIVEVETALNNVRVLDEMLTRHQESPASQPDLDLMLELHSSCASLRTNLYRLVSEMDDKDEGIGRCRYTFSLLSSLFEPVLKFISNFFFVQFSWGSGVWPFSSALPDVSLLAVWVFS